MNSLMIGKIGRHLPLILLLLLVLFFHSWRLSDIPPGLSNDEANIGYEAWSIITTGKDQWGKILPITFEGFGNWSLPVYIYLVAPIIGFLGPTVAAVRGLSILTALALTWLTIMLVKLVRGEKKIGNIPLLAGISVSVTPWIFALTRTASEVPLAMVFFLLALPSYLKSKTRPSYISLTALFAGLSMITYYGMLVFVPLFFLVLFFLDRETWKLKAKQLILPVIVALLVGGLYLKISVIQGGNARLNQVNFIKDPAVRGELNSRLGGCQETYPAFLCHIFWNRPAWFTKRYIENYVSHFSSRELFIANTNTGFLPPGGFFLFIQAPLMGLGLWQVLRKGSTLEKKIYGSWILLAPIGDSISSPGNFTRGFMLAIPLSILSAYGIASVHRTIQKLVLSGLFLAWASFFMTYTSYFPLMHSSFTHYEYQTLMQRFSGVSDIPILISSRFRDTKQYIFYLFYQKIPPSEFQRNQTVEREVEAYGWIWVKRINNWYFVKSFPEDDKLPTDSLLVGASKEEMEPLKNRLLPCQSSPGPIEEIVRFKNGDPAFSIVRVKRAASGEICIAKLEPPLGEFQQ